MRKLFLLLAVLLPLMSHAQQLGRLPGSVYPADRGPRTFATLQSINTVARPAYQWYFDGVWSVTADFSFKAGDVVRMLPGSYFILNTNCTLDFANAEFIAPRQTCFYGTGTVVNIKYPQLFPEWYGVANDFGLPAGYADYPVAFSNVQQDFDYTNKLGNTNLLEHLRYIDLHIDDHTRAGYADTNALVTSSVATVASATALAASNTSVAVSNAVKDLWDYPQMVLFARLDTALSLTNVTPSVGILTNWTANPIDISNSFDLVTGVYTTKLDGYYTVAFDSTGLRGAADVKDFSIRTNNVHYASVANYGTAGHGPNVSLTSGVYVPKDTLLSIAFTQTIGMWTNAASHLMITRTRGGYGL